MQIRLEPVARNAFATSHSMPEGRVLEDTCRPQDRLSAATASTQSNFQLRGFAISLLIAGMAFAAVGRFGANFQNSDEVHPTSLGGDFLQEWIGGFVIANGNAKQLYDAEFTYQLQHDASVVGFQWKTTSYFPMVYPPAWYATFSGLATLDYRTASFVWLAALAVSIPVIFLLVSTWDSAVSYQPVIFTIALLMFPPVLQSIVMTQKSLLWLTILLATFVLARRNRDWEAGAVFGLCIWKPTLVPVILVMMILSRRWRFVLGAALSAGSIFLLSLLAVPLSVWTDYLQVVRQAGSYHENAGYSPELAQNLGCVLMPLSGGDRSVYWAMYLVAGSGIACLIYWIANAPSTKASPPNVRSLGNCNRDGFYLAAILGTILLSPHFYFYDLAILLVAACAVRGRFPRSTANGWIAAIYLAAVLNPIIVDTLGIPLLPLILVAQLIATAMRISDDSTAHKSVVSLGH